jgi:uncharacterized membrane protein
MEQENLGGDEREAGKLRGIDRVNGFSDAVFAVAITLLILTITVPIVSDSGELASALDAMWPQFISFLISFVIIGQFWMSHHVMFRYLQRHSPGFLWINLFFLMFIVFLPFSTDLMSEYGDSVLAVAFYDLNMVAASGTLLLLWWYMSYHKNLVSDDLDPGLRRHLLLNQSAIAFVFLCAIGIAFINIPASQYFYLTLIPAGFFLERVSRKFSSQGDLNSGS